MARAASVSRQLVQRKLPARATRGGASKRKTPVRRCRGAPHSRHVPHKKIPVPAVQARPSSWVEHFDSCLRVRGSTACRERLSLLQLKASTLPEAMCELTAAAADGLAGKGWRLRRRARSGAIGCASTPPMSSSFSSKRLSKRGTCRNPRCFGSIFFSCLSGACRRCSAAILRGAPRLILRRARLQSQDGVLDSSEQARCESCC